MYYILYKEYDPDFWVELKFDSPFGFDYYYIDIDDDGSFDVAYSIWGEDHFTISQMGTYEKKTFRATDSFEITGPFQVNSGGEMTVIMQQCPE